MAAAAARGATICRTQAFAPLVGVPETSLRVETFVRFGEGAVVDIPSSSTSTTFNLSSASFSCASAAFTSSRELLRRSFAKSTSLVSDDSREMAAARRCLIALISCLPHDSMLLPPLFSDDPPPPPPVEEGVEGDLGAEEEEGDFPLVGGGGGERLPFFCCPCPCCAPRMRTACCARRMKAACSLLLET